MFDADHYPDMDNTISESGEAINAFIQRAKSFMQYLSWENFICFLRVRFAIRYYVPVLEDRKLYREDSDVNDVTSLSSLNHSARIFTALSEVFASSLLTRRNGRNDERFCQNDRAHVDNLTIVIIPK